MQCASDQLRLMAGKFPDETAFKDVSSGLTLTFAVWEEQSNRLARGMVAHGVQARDRVVLGVPPHRPLDWIAAYAAVHKAGAVAVPLNTRLAPAEVASIVDHAAPAMVIDEATDLADLEEPDGTTFQVPVEADDLADILYTSGTTGRPKGVAVSHANLSFLPTMEPRWTGPGWLSSSPLFTFAGSSQVYLAMKLGLTALHQPQFEVNGWLDAVEIERPTMVFLVPAMVELLLSHERTTTADLSSLRSVAIGSAPLPVVTLQRFRELVPGVPVTNNYNLTEAGTAYFSMPPDEVERRPGSIGRPQPPTQVRIVDDAGAVVPAGEVGELQLQVPGRMRHYYREPAATQETWTDGWLRSGDLARVDEDGFVFIVGRKKDVIIRGGNNIYAADVEAVLVEHPDVQQAAVAGLAHPVLGEDVGAWVVLRAGATTTPDDLAAHCRARLGDYKVPRRIQLLDDLPRNAMGKVIKAELPR